jgi:type IV pilus assembly protein PilW
MKLIHLHPHTGYKRQRGISLVELMVAMALGLVLTLGVTQVFLGSSKTYRTSDAVAYLQENLRYSLARISADLRMAGSQGCLVGEPTDHLRNGNAAYEAMFWDAGRAVVGWEADDTGLGAEIEISGFEVGGDDWGNGVTATATPPNELKNNAISGTDFLVVTMAERVNVVLPNNPSTTANVIGTTGASGINEGSILVAVTEDCSAGDRFQKTNANTEAGIAIAREVGSPGNEPATVLQTYTDKAALYRYRSQGYFIGLGVNDEPALFRVTLTPGESNAPVELVNGVENMQILYGIANSQARAEKYVDATEVGNWEDVVSVRIALLMSSGDQILDQDNEQTFNLIGVNVDPGSDRRARLIATTTVGLRNRLE